MSDLPRQGTAHWAVAAQVARGDDVSDIGTGTAPDTPAGRRVFRLDGRPARNRAEIAQRLSALWLTPQMDRLFLEGAGGRRRFLDRLVLALEPGHAREVAAHDEAMQSRNRLLAGGRADAAWLAALERSMARHAVAVVAARRALVARLNAAADAGTGGAGGFPPARLALLCPIGARLDQEPALAVEDWLCALLAEARGSDAQVGAAAHGAHRSDLVLSDRATGRPAAGASTGQQKALLIGVVLAHAALVADLRGEPPLLLLDEPLVHLDEARRSALFSALCNTPSQVLLTGTDRAPFAPLEGVAGFWHANGGQLAREGAAGEAGPWFEAPGDTII